MYKIDSNISDSILDEYYNTYKDLVNNQMEYFLKGGQLEKKIGGQVNRINMSVKLSNDGFTRYFIEKHIENLRPLICGTVNDQLSIIKFVFDKLGESSLGISYRIDNYQDFLKIDERGESYIDDFHTIMHYIFVDSIFNKKQRGENVFNKKKFINDRGLSYCPYCGIEEISVDESENAPDWTPPLDHFLPKEKYPYLGINFYNLIPSCTKCNCLQNKGSNNPYSKDLRIKFLVNPYDFSSNIVKYRAEYNFMGLFANDNYKISSIPQNENYKIGYFDWLKLNKRYARKSSEARDIYKNMAVCSDSFKVFLSNYGIKEDYLSEVSRMILGFDINDKDACHEQMYKFKTDIFLQLIEMLDSEILDRLQNQLHI